jgi:hypothetical protein
MHAGGVEPGVAVAVVAGPLLGVAEDVVGLGRLLEPRLRLGVARVPVRVVLHRQLAVGALDLLVRGVLGHPEDFVQVPFSGHAVIRCGHGSWRPVAP